MNDLAKIEGGLWPTPAQELLLRAALTLGEESLAAWQEWQKGTDIETLDAGSCRLLPLLRRNLEAQDVKSPLLMRYKSVSRHWWVRNQLLLAQAAQLIQLLGDEGITTLVLKGGALISLYYHDVSTRPIRDFDLLVPTRQAPRAFQALLDKGYQSFRWDNSPPPTQRSLSIYHAVTFKSKSSDAEEFDIHAHVFPGSFSFDADDEFWNASVRMQLNDVWTRALCAEDMLLHVCAHGLIWNPVPPLRWIADASLILRATPNFDWERLMVQAQRHHLTLRLRHALEYLHRLDLHLPIPESALHQIKHTPISSEERWEWDEISCLNSHPPLGLKLWSRALAYSRWNKLNPPWQRPFTLPLYLQFYWRLSSLSQVPSEGLSRLYRYFRQT
jgi:hypothetical protein